MKRTSDWTDVASCASFNFLALQRDLQLLILTAVGHDIFAVNCTCATLRQLIGDPLNRVMENIWVFRHFFRMDCLFPLRKSQVPLDNRLLQLKPRVIEMAHSMPVGWDTLLAMKESLTALSLYSFDWASTRKGANTRDPERVLGQLTALRHLIIWDCSFDSHREDTLLENDICDQLALLTRLETLSIASDDKFDADIVRHMTALHYLDLSTATDVHMESLTHLRGLKTLTLSSAELEPLSRHLTSLTNLTRLSLICDTDDASGEPLLPDLSFLPPRITAAPNQIPFPWALLDLPKHHYYWEGVCLSSESSDEEEESSSAEESSSSESGYDDFISYETSGEISMDG